ncbi:MAG: hypothetical protein O7F70_05110, partial [Gemmatimonadetes bacterium]|nr:hypothetical protein [Gemmatimonadota bacterium]
MELDSQQRCRQLIRGADTGDTRTKPGIPKMREMPITSWTFALPASHSSSRVAMPKSRTLRLASCQEDWEDFHYLGRNNHKESSKYLHEGFWSWREDYPSQPFWAHFQTTDTHENYPAPPPFGGLFVTADESESWNESFERLGEFGGIGPYSPAWDSTGISRTAFFTVAKGLYDEAMAH